MLKSDHVFLRTLESSDLDHLYAWENNTDNWEVSGTLAPYTKETLLSFIENSDKDIYTTKQFRFVICLNNGLPIGTIDLFDFDPQNLNVGVGILIGDEKLRNKGYAREALTLLLTYCKKSLKVNSLFCNIEESNEASKRLFTSLGFDKTGIKKQWLRKFDGKFYDVGFYQLML